MTLAPRISAAPLSLEEEHLLGMAEMGFAGLSEQWLMRRAGDMHWRLIARALGQRNAVFTCAAGQPLYATFLASSLRLTAPHLPQLCDRLELSASLWSIGRNRLASEITLTVPGGRVGCLRLVSTFAGRLDPASNRTMVRRMPPAIAVLPEAPLALQSLARHAAKVSRGMGGLATGGRTASVRPCVATDFNAAGLLYFPSFAALADRCEDPMAQLCGRILAARHVVYGGNIEPGEAVSVSFQERANGHLAQIARADGQSIAVLRTRFAERKASA